MARSALVNDERGACLPADGEPCYHASMYSTPSDRTSRAIAASVALAACAFCVCSLAACARYEEVLTVPADGAVAAAALQRGADGDVAPLVILKEASDEAGDIEGGAARYRVFPSGRVFELRDAVEFRIGPDEGAFICAGMDAEGRRVVVRSGAEARNAYPGGTDLALCENGRDYAAFVRREAGNAESGKISVNGRALRDASGFLGFSFSTGGDRFVVAERERGFVKVACYLKDDEIYREENRFSAWFPGLDSLAFEFGPDSVLRLRAKYDYGECVREEDSFPERVEGAGGYFGEGEESEEDARARSLVFSADSGSREWRIVRNVPVQGPPVPIIFAHDDEYRKTVAAGFAPTGEERSDPEDYLMFGGFFRRVRERIVFSAVEGARTLMKRDLELTRFGSPVDLSPEYVFSRLSRTAVEEGGLFCRAGYAHDGEPVVAFSAPRGSGDAERRVFVGKRRYDNFADFRVPADRFGTRGGSVVLVDAAGAEILVNGRSAPRGPYEAVHDVVSAKDAIRALVTKAGRLMILRSGEIDLEPAKDGGPDRRRSAQGISVKSLPPLRDLRVNDSIVDGNRAFLATNRGAFFSFDGGATWERHCSYWDLPGLADWSSDERGGEKGGKTAAAGFTGKGGDPRWEEVASSAEEPGLAVVGTASGLFVARDGGKGWKRYSAADGLAGDNIEEVVVRGGRIAAFSLPSYIAFNERGAPIFMLNGDFGTFTLYFKSAYVWDVDRLLPSQVDPNLRYRLGERIRGHEDSGFSRVFREKGCYGGLSLSEDGGKTWRAVRFGTPPLPADLNELRFATSGDSLYCLSASGVSRSDDWGRTWGSPVEAVPTDYVSFVERRGKLYITDRGGYRALERTAAGWTALADGPVRRLDLNDCADMEERNGTILVRTSQGEVHEYSIEHGWWTR